MPDRFDAAALALGSGAIGDVGSPGTALSLDVQARLVGWHQWVERKLFEVLGSWVASEPVPEAEVLFDVYSQQHAWHAELFADRLPALDSVDPNSLMVPPSIEVDRMLGVLGGTVPVGEHAAASGTLMERGSGSGTPGGGTLPRLVGVGRVVLPRLVVGYTLHLRRVGLVVDAPLARCLGLVLRDELEQWQAVEALTQALLRRPHDVAVVTGHQERLEQMIAGSGAGIVAWPEAKVPSETGPEPPPS